jgi:hypothetical protein
LIWLIRQVQAGCSYPSRKAVALVGYEEQRNGRCRGARTDADAVREWVVPERRISVICDDINIGYADVHALSNPDAVAAFFERLGYNTSIRRIQTPANLGITAESTLRPIKKIELLANQEGLLQVYLFELRSVTVAHTRLIANAFRLLAGNYLLVLTSDYELLDFVLLEREHPSAPGSSIGAPQVKVRPRTLTVERLKPERLHLRILRRFTLTEPDPFAQYEKLTAAYTVAAWSEEYFNNRALFSDHYLSERLREFPEWNEDAKPAWTRLRELYARCGHAIGR